MIKRKFIRDDGVEFGYNSLINNPRLTLVEYQDEPLEVEEPKVERLSLSEKEQKDVLISYARAKFGVVIDKRKTLNGVKKQMEMLENGDKC